jgi:hypothetical protein
MIDSRLRFSEPLGAEREPSILLCKINKQKYRIFVRVFHAP